MMGSNNILNVGWTAPVMILFGTYLQKSLGTLFMTRLFFLSMFSTFLFWSIFNPQTGLNKRPLHYEIQGLKFDSCAKDGSYYMGAD